MSITLLLIATACIAISGIPGLLLPRKAMTGQWIAMMLNLTGSLIGFVALIIHNSDSTFSRNWSLPLGHFSVAIDSLSALFLIPLLLIPTLASIYGLEYWPQSRHPTTGQKLRLCWGLLTAGMMLVILARDGVLLLIAWEIMSLAAYFLVVTEDKKPQVRRAGWIYLIAAHFGAMCLFATFTLLHYATGSFDLWPQASDQGSASIRAAIFITGILGFGVKAGIMPLHVWLPGAHANAPSHVSAIMSGVMLNCGIYGIVRISGFSPNPPLWCGATLLTLGAISGILGIAFAIVQQDFKRLLAYSSIENIGIITIGIGLALLGKSLNRPDLILLGLAGALLHMLNHSLFKPLLFMTAGNILHATRTRQIDSLGGLSKSMPKTFGLATIGAVAICGLPPLNGFISELLIYVGLFHTAILSQGKSCLWAAMAAPALAMIGALALAGFVKLIGITFGGSPRTPAAQRAHDPKTKMLAPMVLLAGCCIAIGIVPVATLPLLQSAVAVWDPRPAQLGLTIATYIPLGWFSAMAIALLAIIFIAAIAYQRWQNRSPVASAGTWDCGYAQPSATMQYTSSSFAQSAAAIFNWALLPRKIFTGLSGLFPGRSRFASDTPDVVLDRAMVPTFSLAERIAQRARPIQRGRVQVYLLYILSALLVLLLLAELWS